MPLARLNHALLHYRLEGPSDAPVLLLSNSLGTDLRMWDAQMATLTTRFRVLRYDTRGHGRSIGGVGPYTLDDLGGDVLELLDHLHLTRVHVCGVSLGGMTALWLALHARHRVLSIMPCNTAARIGTAVGWDERIHQVMEHGLESIAEATMSRWFTEGFRRNHAEQVERTRKMLCATNRTAYSWCCAALRQADLRGQIHSIDLPVLVISGTEDPVTPPADGFFLHKTIPGSAYLELNAAHLSNMEAAQSFSEAAGDFFTHSH
jgi:3-oxoadipate enol-lactonase